MWAASPQVRMAAEMLERDRANGDARFDHVEYTLPPVSPGRLPPSSSRSPATHTPAGCDSSVARGHRPPPNHTRP
jgi:hypothetical protein